MFKRLADLDLLEVFIHCGIAFLCIETHGVEPLIILVIHHVDHDIMRS